MRRHSGGHLLKAAEWYSLHTGKHVVVLSESLAHQLGSGGGNHNGSGGGMEGDLHDAMGTLAISTAAESQCASHSIIGRYICQLHEFL